MSDFQERAFLFECAGDVLPGIVCLPGDDSVLGAIGVLIVVGGPQYRVGSHRQFVRLARYLGERGIPCMRFDYRGMGDATGEQRGFNAVEDDIAAAIDAFYEEVPTLSGVLLWGLCDGATASVYYNANDARVKGLMLLNPWVHSDVGEAKVRLRHYYVQRFFSRAFWTKFLGGGVAPASSLRELMQSAKLAFGHEREPRTVQLGAPERILATLRSMIKPWWLLLSGQDYVAREFDSAASLWADLLEPQAIWRLPRADHTFSRAASTEEVAEKTSLAVAALAGITAKNA